MNHKRRKRRNLRAGCKWCKPWKMNGVRTEAEEGEKFSDHRRRLIAREWLNMAPAGREVW